MAAMLALRFPSSAMMMEPLRSDLIGSAILGDSKVDSIRVRKIWGTSRRTRDTKPKKRKSFDRLVDHLFMFTL